MSAWLTVAAVLLGVADGALTQMVTNGNHLLEANPLVALAMAGLGVWWMAPKLAVSVAAPLALHWAEAVTAQRVVVAAYSAVVLYQLALLATR